MLGQRKGGKRRKGRHAAHGTIPGAMQRLHGPNYPEFSASDGLLGADNTISCRGLVKEEMKNKSSHLDIFQKILQITSIVIQL